jgi:hypothetical protein
MRRVRLRFLYSAVRVLVIALLAAALLLRQQRISRNGNSTRWQECFNRGHCPIVGGSVLYAVQDSSP